MATASEKIIEAIRRLGATSDRPVVVALDGRSGAGKSWLAERVARDIEATVVPSDDFFAAERTDAEWEARDPAERARDVLDWRRLRREALELLLEARPARWHAFDFERGPRPDGSYAFEREAEVREPRPVILLEGAYAARPELSDLVALAVLLEAPASTRQTRLAGREDPDFLERWHERWQAAEDHYFTVIRPPSSFDLVVQNG